MSKLVILVSPSEMQRNKHEIALRELFEAHENDATIENVSEFLDAKEVPYSIQVGVNEYGITLTAFCIEDVPLIAIKHE